MLRLTFTFSLFVFYFMSFCQQISPNGYYVLGNKVFDANNKQVLFKGVNRCSMEWNAAGQKLVKKDIQAIASSCSNIIRLPLNQDFWLKNTSNYQAKVDSVVKWCMSENLHVILDLHWSQKNDPNVTAEQQKMADEISLIFWKQVASKYKNNGKILFELYNEPHQITWNEVVNGGINDNGTTIASDDWKMVGYQQLYDTVRATGAKNLVIIGGNNWTYDLSYYETNPIKGYNIMYATHLYPFSNKLSNNWYKWTKIAKSYPVIASEFGPAATKSTNYVQEAVDTLQKLNGHFTAWAWWSFGPDNNGFWNSFDPNTGIYDTTYYGKWFFSMMKKECNKVITSVDEESSKNSSNDQFFVRIANRTLIATSIENATWQLLDINGKLFFEAENKEAIEVNMGTFRDGIYILKIQSRGITKIHKFYII